MSSRGRAWEGAGSRAERVCGPTGLVFADQRREGQTGEVRGALGRAGGRAKEEEGPGRLRKGLQGAGEGTEVHKWRADRLGLVCRSFFFSVSIMKKFNAQKEYCEP